MLLTRMHTTRCLLNSLERIAAARVNTPWQIHSFRSLAVLLDALSALSILLLREAFLGSKKPLRMPASTRMVRRHFPNGLQLGPEVRTCWRGRRLVPNPVIMPKFVQTLILFPRIPYTLTFDFAAVIQLAAAIIRFWLVSARPQLMKILTLLT